MASPLGFFRTLFGFARTSRAETLFAAVMNRARDPRLYAPPYAVPDTVDGRFELLVVHCHLVLRNLGNSAEAKALGQQLFDRVAKDLDVMFREFGVADINVGRHVNRMAKGFFGRANAYEEGLLSAAEGDFTLLTTALWRNVFAEAEGRAAEAENLARYCQALSDAIARQTFTQIEAGELGADPLPALLKETAA